MLRRFLSEALRGALPTYEVNAVGNYLHEWQTYRLPSRRVYGNECPSTRSSIPVFV
jgi:hypothetical protein